MIIVTGGAGFIGSNLVAALNRKGIDDILVVDDLKDGRKFKNLTDCKFADYLDKDDFLQKVKTNTNFSNKIKAIFHQGACSDTTEWDGKMMMANNYEYSKTLLNYSLNSNIPFIYASSAAVYGNNTKFSESAENECPLNVYGYSKLLFDQYVRRILPKATSQISGLRYFNVYGPRECHKGSMASVAYHLHQQLKAGKDTVKLFAGSGGYKDGEQLRDFIYVDDICAVNLWLLENQQHSGIFNLGTGKCQSFNDVANSVINWHQRGKIEYIPFPEKLINHYQSYTQADMSLLKNIGCNINFHTVEQAIPKYLDWLETNA